MAGKHSRPAEADSPAEERQLTIDEALGYSDSGTSRDVPHSSDGAGSDDGADDNGDDVALDEELGSADPDQCEAYADSTGERCKRPAMGPFPYCGDHNHLIDEDELR